MELKDKLKQLRQSKGITQQELANAIFVSRSAIAKWENGLGLPSADSMEALAQFYGIPQAQLVTAEAEQVIVQKNQKLRKLCALFGGLLFLLFFVLAAALPALLYSGSYGFTPQMAAGTFVNYPYIDTGDYHIYYSIFEGNWEDGRHWTSLSHFKPVQLHFWGCTVSESDYSYDIILHNNTMVGSLYSIRGKNGYYNIIRNSNGNGIVDADLITAKEIRVNGAAYPLEEGFFFVTPEPVECFWIGEGFYQVE